MFFAHCPTFDTTVMMSASAVVELQNADDGIRVVLRCSCGEHLTALNYPHKKVTAAA